MTDTIASHVHTIKGHSRDVNGVCFSNDKLATCSSDKTVRLWSLEDFSEDASSPLCGHKYCVHACVFSPSGTTLATCSTDGKLILWDGKTGQKLAVLEHSSGGSIRACRFSLTSDLLVTGSDDDKLCIWDVKGRKLIRVLDGHDASIVAVAFSPDCALIISGTPSGDLRIWDAKFGHGKPLLCYLDAHDLGVTCCDFSPTYGSAGVNLTLNPAIQIHFLLATCGFDGNVKLWDILAHTGSPDVQLKLRNTLSGHHGHVMCCVFSPDGKMIASGAGDKTVKLWDPFRGVCLHTISGHSRFVTSCAFSKDGNYLASGSNDRTVKIWNICKEQELRGEVDIDDLLVDVSQNIPTRKAVEKWTVDEVYQWVLELGLDQYAQRFKEHAIDGTELSMLTHHTLQKSLNIDALGHRNKILRAVQCINTHPIIQPKDDDSGIPDEYLCPITREVMKEPVIASDGYTYERSAITAWISSGKNRSPMTNSLLTSNSLVPNRNLKVMVQRYLQENA